MTDEELREMISNGATKGEKDSAVTSSGFYSILNRSNHWSSIYITIYVGLLYQFAYALKSIIQILRLLFQNLSIHFISYKFFDDCIGICLLNAFKLLNNFLGGVWIIKLFNNDFDNNYLNLIKIMIFSYN